DTPPNQISRQRRQSIDLILGPTVFDRNILALDIAIILQALAKCGQHNVPERARLAVEERDHRHRPLLRARRERPCRRAADQRDEIAPLHHSITSSARASTDDGRSRPRALAVLRLITSSYLVGACTGRSAGFSPFRTRST